jgi:hypothetical protein
MFRLSLVGAANRAAIVSWMMKGATKTAPARPSLPTNLSQLSNAEFVKAPADMGIPHTGTLV